MTKRTYDVVIVGARCAGAALAIYLARRGAAVIVLEAGRLGTDQVLSTHTIHPPGMDFLDELGVGDAVRSASPPARCIRFQVDETWVDVKPAADRHECCPRRYRLDRLLQEAAIAAGAEIQEKARVTDVLYDRGRVVGVKADHDGREIEVHGAVTVGADGRNSTVARLVGAEEYLGYDAPRGMYWAYWEPPAVWKSPAFPYDFLLRFCGNNRRVIFPTDNGQLLIATLPILEKARDWRSDLERAYMDDLRADPEFALLVNGGRMVSKIIGTVSERFFFRRAAGPGWALVGDAGHHKDPILGWGISEALAQAKHLSDAIAEGSDTARERYWRQRDVDSLPRFRIGEDRAMPGPITPIFPVVLRQLGSNPEMAQLLARETEYDVNPYEVMPVFKVAAWTATEVLRGRPSLIRDFFAMGRRASSVQAELKERRKLLDEAKAA